MGIPTPPPLSSVFRISGFTVADCSAFLPNCQVFNVEQKWVIFLRLLTADSFEPHWTCLDQDDSLFDKCGKHMRYVQYLVHREPQSHWGSLVWTLWQNKNQIWGMEAVLYFWQKAKEKDLSNFLRGNELGIHVKSIFILL